MAILSRLPKQITLRGGEQVLLRILEAQDEQQLYKFLKSLPSRERNYFRDDVTDQRVVHDWCQDISLDKIIPIIAIKDGTIIANWSMHMREHGWTRHHASIRGIVHPEHRQSGLASFIVYELLSIAQELEIEKAVIELVSPQKRLLTHFKSIGFSVEAVLKSWIKDSKGKYQDLQILSMKIEPAWKKMEEMILDYGTHGG